ncbi:unnamed protein product [Triticum turgidum subsp. durum]|uniref:Uncharacterized protein n=1 Tax=Triticum turgidum subsp. durum TaxID=4567 RepID=A0A9R0TH87_TRITD|nr:unnamed protein product [Triticum turgidum subsp. durum]
MQFPLPLALSNSTSVDWSIDVDARLLLLSSDKAITPPDLLRWRPQRRCVLRLNLSRSSHKSLALYMQAHGRPVQVELQLSMEARVKPPQGTRHQRGPAPGRVGGGHHHLASPPLSAHTSPATCTWGHQGR